jgi:hypothetical protein
MKVVVRLGAFNYTFVHRSIGHRNAARAWRTKEMNRAAVSGFIRAPAWSPCDSQGIPAIAVGTCPMMGLSDK